MLKRTIEGNKVHRYLGAMMENQGDSEREMHNEITITYVWNLFQRKRNK